MTNQQHTQRKYKQRYGIHLHLDTCLVINQICRAEPDLNNMFHLRSIFWGIHI
nr:unnamed protein product [Callosobruchus chinensis]